MNHLQCGLPEIRLRQPVALGPRLFFQVFNGTHAIAYAHLSARNAVLARQQSQSSEDSSAVRSLGISYCLKNIEVSHAYRNRGIGTALLDEVVKFCRESQVSSIYGEAKGDMETLRRWYKGSGFKLNQRDHIRLNMAVEQAD
ncbi:MAG: GNAT family N-acetyltransferase [Pseudohongiellaceae bacterium]